MADGFYTADTYDAMLAYLHEEFGQAWAESRAAPGHEDQGLRKGALRTRLGQYALSIGEQSALQGRLQTFLAFLFGLCKVNEAQLSTGAQGALRKDAFLGAIGSTGVDASSFSEHDN